MKARVTVTDDDGNVYEGDVELLRVSSSGDTETRVSAGGKRRTRDTTVTLDAAPATTDFTLPVRAFMSRYAKGRPGHQVFAVLLARLAGGEVNREVPVDQLKAEWNNMRGLLGGVYAPIYGTRAKNNAWADSPARGVFVLLPDWTQALGNGT